MYLILGLTLSLVAGDTFTGTATIDGIGAAHRGDVGTVFDTVNVGIELIQVALFGFGTDESVSEQGARSGACAIGVAASAVVGEAVVTGLVAFDEAVAADRTHDAAGRVTFHSGGHSGVALFQFGAPGSVAAVTLTARKQGDRSEGTDEYECVMRLVR